MRGWVANQPTLINGDAKILEAIAAGQCDVGVTNTYYLGRALAKDPSLPVRPFWPDQAGPGVHVNISGAGVIAHSKQRAEAIKFLEFLSTPEAQAVWAEASFEYPANPAGAPPGRSWPSGAPSRWMTSTSPAAGEFQAAATQARRPRRVPLAADRAWPASSGAAGAIGPRAPALVALVRGGPRGRRPRLPPDPHRALVARPSRLGGLGASRAHPAAGAAPQHGGPGRRGGPRHPPPRDDARVARRDVRVPGPARVRVGAGPAARAPRLRHRLRLPRHLRVRGPPPDRPPRLARPRRPPPGPPLGLGRGARDDARLLPLRLHARASRARRAGAGVPRDRAGPRALADGDPVRASPCHWRGPRSPPARSWPAWRRWRTSARSRRSASAR